MNIIHLSRKLSAPIYLTMSAVETSRQLMVRFTEAIEEWEDKNYMENLDDRRKLGMLFELKRVIHFGEFNLSTGEFETAKGMVVNVLKRFYEFYPESRIVKDKMFRQIQEKCEKPLDEFSDFYWFYLLSYTMLIINMEMVKGVGHQFQELTELPEYQPEIFHLTSSQVLETDENDFSMETLQMYVDKVKSFTEKETTFGEIQAYVTSLFEDIEDRNVSIQHISSLFEILATLNIVINNPQGNFTQLFMEKTTVKEDKPKSPTFLAIRMNEELQQLVAKFS